MWQSGDMRQYDIQPITEQFNVLDQNVVKAAKDLQYGRISLDEFNAIAAQSSATVTKFSNALKSAAINMGAMLAVTLAVQAAIYIIDELYVSFEEQQEIVDNLTTKIEDLKQEYDALQQDREQIEKMIESKIRL